MRNFGPFEILLIVGLILLLFGGKKIPELMRGLGTGINEFKNASTSTEKDEDVKSTTTTPPTTKV